MSKTPTGLLAVAIVGGTFAIVAIVGVVVMATPSKPTTNGNANTATTPASSREQQQEQFMPVETEDFKKVRNHVFWSKPLSKERLQEILKTVQQTNKGHAFEFNRAGEMIIYKMVDLEDNDRKLPDDVLAWIRKNRQTMSLFDPFSGRPTYEKILFEMSVALDVAEYREGPTKPKR